MHVGVAWGDERTPVARERERMVAKAVFIAIDGPGNLIFEF